MKKISRGRPGKTKPKMAGLQYEKADQAAAAMAPPPGGGMGGPPSPMGGQMPPDDGEMPNA
jgi:hypothetical protein